MKKTIYTLAFLFTGAAIPLLSSAQCTAPAAQPACPTGATALPSGTTNIGGNSYYYAGTGTQSSTVHITNGSSITVCSGTLNLSFNGGNNTGTITVLSGASLYINAFNTTNGTTTINNYGTVNFFDHVSLSNGSSVNLTNASGGTLNFYDSVILSNTTPYSSFSVSNFGTINALYGIFSVPLIYSDKMFCMGQNAICNFSPASIVTSGVIPGSGQIFSLATGATKACVLLNSNASYTAGINFASVPGVRISAPAATPITGYGSATIYYNSTGCSYALPLTLIDFSAAATSKGTNTISFKTASEKELSSYMIENSADGKYFATLSAITPTNNGSVNSYSYVDAAAGATAYYRLKMVDINGDFTYSNTVSVHNGDASGTVLISPNPATGNIAVSLPAIATGAVAYTVYDLTGKLAIANNMVPTDGSKLMIDVSNLVPGSYILSLHSGNNIYHTRFVKAGN